MATRMIDMTDATELNHAVPTMRTSASALFTSQIAALFLMTAGWGWIAGNFVQPANTSWGATMDFVHVIPLAILVTVSLRFIHTTVAATRTRGALYGITALAIYGLVGCTVMVVLGLMNPDPNSVGVHTFEDWMPVIVLNAGTLLWLGSLLAARRRP